MVISARSCRGKRYFKTRRHVVNLDSVISNEATVGLIFCDDFIPLQFLTSRISVFSMMINLFPTVLLLICGIVQDPTPFASLTAGYRARAAACSSLLHLLLPIQPYIRVL
jgi:hypothetical protein